MRVLPVLLLALCISITVAHRDSRGRGKGRRLWEARGNGFGKGKGLDKLFQLFEEERWAEIGRWTEKNRDWSREEGLEWIRSRFCRARLFKKYDNAPTPPVDMLPVSQMRTIVGACEADVGACPTGACAFTNMRRHPKCPLDGHVCPKTVEREVKCGKFGSFNVSFVTACKCCKNEGILINGIVIDASDDSLIENAYLKSGRRNIDVSDINGEFALNVDSDRSRVVIRAKHDQYVSTIKVVEIPAGFMGPVDVVIAMIKVADPVEIDATVDNELSVANDSTTGEEIASITIPAGSFRTKDGVYKGAVRTSINFIDPSNKAVEAEIPGQFITESDEPLITDGLFAVSYSAVTGEPLTAGLVTVKVRAGMKLWRLTDDGKWEAVSSRQPGAFSAARKRRQIALTDQFLLNIENGRWVNIDKIPGAPRCYFKGRIFDETSGTEITSSSTATFRPSVVAYTTQNQRLRFYLGATSSPAATCHEVRCTATPTNNNTLLVGIISMETFESVSVGGVSIPVVNQLTPRNLIDYSAAIQPPLAAVQYQVVPTGDELFVNYISDVNGPFYRNLQTCQNSTVSEPAVHFLKPELPSYLPVPNDTELCTARIGYFDGWNFNDSLNEMTSLPSVTAISTWAIDGVSYYYTDTAVMERKWSNGEDFIQLCIQYRCSSADANTTVYLDVDVPTVTVNITGQDIHEAPAFGCWGNCTNGDCNGPQIEGSFTAPFNFTEGQGFFSEMQNACADGARNETFAAHYTCYSKREFEGEFRQLA